MGLNFRKIYTDFYKEQAILKKEYLKAGMSELQIREMLEFDKQSLARDYAYYRRTQHFGLKLLEDNVEDKDPLYEKFLEKISVGMDFSILSNNWWIEEIEKEYIYEAIQELSDIEVHILFNVVICGRTKQEVAEELNISVRQFYRKYNKIKQQMEKTRNKFEI